MVNADESDFEGKSLESFPEAYEVLDQGHDLPPTLTKRISEASIKSNADNAALERYLTDLTEVVGVIPFNSSDPRLNPESSEFDAKLWVKNMRKLQMSDKDYYRPEALSMAFKNLRMRGIAADTDYQPTVLNGVGKYLMNGIDYFRKHDDSRYFDILKSMDGYIGAGELTAVLGRPGSGCTTLLKTVAANTYGLKIADETKITYDGISQLEIRSRFRGNVIYSSEVDNHYAKMTVGDTLEFVATMKTPRNRNGVESSVYAKHMASAIMAMYGLSHTRDTFVGDDFVRGVSGGERKRVSIAEAALSGNSIQCWDNATRGLDSATALEFVRALKTSTKVMETACMISIYQCSEETYGLFDNIILLYEGYQIYNWKAKEAKIFFEQMGYECPQRQTTADFLTSLTNPSERIIRKGYENKVPTTPEGFREYWRKSPQCRRLVERIDGYFEKSMDGSKKERYALSQRSRQSKHVPQTSPYNLSYFRQVINLIRRNFLRVRRAPSLMIIGFVSRMVMGFIIGSALYNQKDVTTSFYSRGAALYFGLLFNALSSLIEIFSIFANREVVQKQSNYALYYPSADALAGILSDLPNKIGQSLFFNFPLYFLVNLRREAGRFFFFLLMVFLATMAMGNMFRCMAVIFNTFAQAMTFCVVLLLALNIFTGFALPVGSMLGWSRWINYIDPLGYTFESLLSNEFNGRKFHCDQVVPDGPGYSNTSMGNKGCASLGSDPGLDLVTGEKYINTAYKYSDTHKWRNFGILVGFVFFFMCLYVVLAEFSKGKRLKGDVILYLRSHLKQVARNRKKHSQDLEAGRSLEKTNSSRGQGFNEKSAYTNNGDKNSFSISERQIFHWRNLTYEVKVKDGNRVLLDHVDGWVKPGEVTALMGSSGAGKTTLLNCLSDRLSVGAVTHGARMVNGKILDNSFQRSIGYCQQQDIHLPMQTIREALRFSALLRQSSHISKKEKYEYVEDVIDLLEMTEYADALVGVAGEGLNIEQRKRLTIGVELVAKPDLLIFLDEPTSGLDSQTAWSICKLIRKLADNGQAILCTIHQPSAILLQEFDRLLLLQKGGQTVYFGELGNDFRTLIDYFEKKGGHSCPSGVNPADWMLEVIGAAPGSKKEQDYFQIWKDSNEYREVQKELDSMEQELSKLPKKKLADSDKKYAASLWTQFFLVTKRAFQLSWRSPQYIYSKIFLVFSAEIFNGFVFFKADLTSQGMQNQMFSIFMTLVPFSTLVNQMLPLFGKQRAVYEAREAPSRTFSWNVFMSVQILSEIPYQLFVATIAYFCWYYPVGFYNNAVPTNEVHSRGITMWLFLSAFYVYATTLGHMCASFTEIAENGMNFATLIFALSMLFCGVMTRPGVFPHFWIFMYRVSPFTYFIQGALATGLANNDMHCEDSEYIVFDAPSGSTCGQYMSNYIKQAGGFLENEQSSTQCRYCQFKTTNDYLKSLNSYWNQRWRNWGIFICYIAVNIIFAIFLYWLARVPKSSRRKKNT